MISTTRLRRTYDHRLRDLVRATGNIEHATRRGIPRSTARGWLSATHARVDDSRKLIAWICASDAYQLQSVTNATNDDGNADPYFSRMLKK